MTPDDNGNKKPTVTVGAVKVTTTEKGGGKNHDWPKVTVEVNNHDWPKIHVQINAISWPSDKAMPESVDISFDLTVKDD